MLWIKSVLLLAIENFYSKAARTKVDRYIYILFFKAANMNGESSQWKISIMFRFLYFTFLLRGKIFRREWAKILTSPEPGDKLQMGFRGIMRKNQFVSEWNLKTGKKILAVVNVIHIGWSNVKSSKRGRILHDEGGGWIFVKIYNPGQL